MIGIKVQFDFTLQSYKLKNRVQVTFKIFPDQKEDKAKLIAIWDEWVKTLNLSLRTLNDHYHCCRVMISKANLAWDDITWFIQSDLSASTWNTRRRFIKSCVT